MTIKINFTNKLNSQIKNRISQVENRIPLMFFKIGTTILKDVRAGMREPKSGNKYVVKYGRGRRMLQKPRDHIASAEGEFPAVLSGDLINSLGFDIRGKEMQIGAEKNYAKFLVDKKRKMFVESLERKQDDIKNIIQTTLDINNKK